MKCYNMLDNATSAVFHNLSIGEWFKTRLTTTPHTVQCILDRIMTDALDGHFGTVSI